MNVGIKSAETITNRANTFFQKNFVYARNAVNIGALFLTNENTTIYTNSDLSFLYLELLNFLYTYYGVFCLYFTLSANLVKWKENAKNENRITRYYRRLKPPVFL